MNHIIVARYNEDVTWAKHLPLDWKVSIIQKGDHLPNEGRESASYIWAFQRGEFADEDLLALVQGDPFQHAPTMVRELYLRPNGFRPFNGWEVECDGEGAPHHKGLPVQEKYEEWFDRKYPGKTCFNAGAQFMVRGKDLKDKDWDAWYERACEEHGPWLLERFWSEIFV